MTSISSGILGFFHGELADQGQIPEAFLKIMMIGLLSTSRMAFLLLQKCWMNSQRESPSFWTMLPMSHLTPGRSQVALKLLMNC
jgi:hypothetical protein